VPGDEDRLGQLIGNLVSNAIKFTPPGGRVTVTMQAVVDYAVVTVTDTGIGIPEADLPHIFERFYRSAGVTSRAIQGSGLGLTISKAIVDAHGGTISAESEPGRGTTFRIRLPLRRAAPARPGLAAGTARVARLMRQCPLGVTGRPGAAAAPARRPEPVPVLVGAAGAEEAGRRQNPTGRPCGERAVNRSTPWRGAANPASRNRWPQPDTVTTRRLRAVPSPNLAVTPVTPGRTP
jgi:anti-sigma regulatory factor (Ser/Thr protein kinase)